MHIIPYVRRRLRFIQAYVCFLQVHRALRQGGFATSRRLFLKPWKPNSRTVAPEDPQVCDVEWAVLQAAAWQWQNSVCLHCALVTYVLLRSCGARPRFRIGIMTRPFASHAWVQLEDQAIADPEMDDARYHYQPMVRIPE